MARHLKLVKSAGFRGKNKCKEVADLMESQKIKIWFYNNHALSKRFVGHLARIAINSGITPSEG
jgi:hypothetical protein